MRANSQILAAALVSGSVVLGALFTRRVATATVVETGGSMMDQAATTAKEPVRRVLQQQPIPGQTGTIPERMQSPDATTRQDMVISMEEIRRAQEALKAKGYDPGAVTGRMHAKTQEALREFQKRSNLAPTGVLDKKTADKLGVIVPDETGPMP